LLIVSHKSRDLQQEWDEVRISTAAAGAQAFELEDVLHVYRCKDMDAITALNYHTFLAIVSESHRGLPGSGTVTVYRYCLEKNKFVKQQTLELGQPEQVKFQLVQATGELLMNVKSRAYLPTFDSTVTVFIFKGSSGWSKVHEIKVEETSSITPHAFHFNHEYKAGFVATERKRFTPYNLEFNGKPSS